MNPRFARLFSCVLLPLAGTAGWAQRVPDYEQPPVSYSSTEPQDAVARLQQRLALGTLAWQGSEGELLREMLRELDVPAESQVVVFSKTSLQRRLIRPSNPRALYFSDSVYVGWVPGGLIEVAAIDPQLGPVFYSLNPRAARGASAQFVRDPDCLSCHGGTFVRDIPGVFVRSVVPGRSGEPLLRHGTQLVDDQTPFAERWGGWYVTGYTGRQPHRGNSFGTEEGDRLTFDASAERPRELSMFFDLKPYPANTSDVVALLVLEHQLAMQNSLTRAAHSCRKMLEYQHSLQKSFQQPITDEPAFDSVKGVFASAVDNLVDRLLFRDEAALPAGVIGDEAFRQAFVEGAPRSRAGHALKDLQLSQRIFAHRCSYLVYSDSFAALPRPLKERVLDRLYAVLRENEFSDRYGYLEAEEKKRIYEILNETHPDARERWRYLAERTVSLGSEG